MLANFGSIESSWASVLILQQWIMRFNSRVDHYLRFSHSNWNVVDQLINICIFGRYLAVDGLLLNSKRIEVRSLLVDFPVISLYFLDCKL